MSIRLKRTVPIVLSVVLVLAFAGTALAASFNWSVHFNDSLKSRSWTQSSGDTTIVSNMNCHQDNQVRTYRIRTVREIALLPDTLYNWKYYDCGDKQSKSWNGLPRGDFHFDLEKTDNSNTYWDGDGVTRYPS
jgi:hypothetical protein